MVMRYLGLPVPQRAPREAASLPCRNSAMWPCRSRSTPSSPIASPKIARALRRRARHRALPREAAVRHRHRTARSRAEVPDPPPEPGARLRTRADARTDATGPLDCAVLHRAHRRSVSHHAAAVGRVPPRRSAITLPTRELLHSMLHPPSGPRCGRRKSRSTRCWNMPY